MGFADFLRTVFHSVNPNSFADLSGRSFKESMEYFLSILFVSFVLMILLLVPAMMMIPKSIETTMEDFSVLSLGINLETTKPVELPSKKPYVVIDTTGTHENISDEKVFVTRDTVFMKNGMCFWFEPACLFYPKESKVKATSLSDYSDLKTHSKTISQLITTLLMFAVPTFVIFLFFLLAVKYFIIILLVTLIALAFARLIKKDTAFSRLFRVATYAATIMIVLEVALLPFKFKMYMAPLIAFIVLVIIGTYLLTEEEVVKADVETLKFRSETKPVKSGHKSSDDDFVDLSKHKLKKM